MYALNDSQFEELIGQAMDAIPKQYRENMNNVAITWEQEPSEEQRAKLRLRCHQSLFGLYEGIPLTRRGSNYQLVLPDKITLFKGPILQAADSERQAKEQIGRTLWHEVAHHFGLGHERIHELESKKAGNSSNGQKLS